MTNYRKLKMAIAFRRVVKGVVDERNQDDLWGVLLAFIDAGCVKGRTINLTMLRDQCVTHNLPSHIYGLLIVVLIRGGCRSVKTG